jgi:hypothetical protein
MTKSSQAAEPPPTTIRLVEHWTEELKQRVPRQ